MDFSSTQSTNTTLNSNINKIFINRLRNTTKEKRKNERLIIANNN
jgi:hypothetical protein